MVTEIVRGVSAVVGVVGRRDGEGRKIVRQSGSNFALAFKFLPPVKRKAVEVFYGFCRQVDDCVDGESGPEAAMEFLRGWMRELNRIERGYSTTLLGSEILKYVVPLRISLDSFRLVLEGVGMDLEKTRYETFEHLYNYCYAVASSVGFFCCELMGVSSSLSKRYAEVTGVAVQLTNILRDVKEDARRGRIYIPVEDMKCFGVDEHSIVEWKANRKVLSLLEFEAERAEHLFGLGEGILSSSEAIKLYFCHLLAGTYRGLLRQLRRRQFGLGSSSKRVRISGRRKILSALKTFISATIVNVW